MRSRIDPTLARRLDGLARRAHAFHRFAHHPLCDEYGAELLRLGRARTRVCRGCTFLVAGLAAGLAASFAARPPSLVAIGAAALATVIAAGGVRRRGPKVVTRFVPGCGFGFALAGGFASAVVALAAFGVLATVYRRRGPDRAPCASCAERTGPAPCRGFVEIVRAERAFQRLSGRWLRSSTALPVAPPGCYEVPSLASRNANAP
jgi:hypothetical protein